MTNENIAAFVAAVPEKRRAACEEALLLVNAAEVYNADYVEAKFILGRSVDEAWHDLHVPYDLYCVVGSVMCLHDIISMSKKVEKALKGVTVWPALVGMKATCDAFLPAALLLKDLKNKTIKARKPPAAEVLAERAAKEASKNRMERATCGCCFREQAVLANGRIHDHGYTLPQSWHKTSSCYGRQFRPLEVSDEGPRFMVTMAMEAVADTLKVIENLKSAKSLQVETKWERRAGFRVPVEFTTIYPDDSKFAAVRDGRIFEAESHLTRIRSDLAKFRKVVAEWKAA